MSIDTILRNIDQYNEDIDNLYLQLRRMGVNTFSDFESKAKEFGVWPISSKIQRPLRNKYANSETDDWQDVCEKCIELCEKDCIERYKEYLGSHQNSPHREEARRRIQELEDKIWQNIDKNSRDDLGRFIADYPDHPKIVKARERLEELEVIGINGVKECIVRISNDENKTQVSKENEIFDLIKDVIGKEQINSNDFAELLATDKNLINNNVANRLITENIIRIKELENHGIDKEFIKFVIDNKGVAQLPNATRTLSEITKKESTEVYFWGIPSSGKSCAIGAILSALDKGMVTYNYKGKNENVVMHAELKCQGFGYMNALLGLFKQGGG